MSYVAIYHHNIVIIILLYCHDVSRETIKNCHDVSLHKVTKLVLNVTRDYDKYILLRKIYIHLYQYRRKHNIKTYNIKTYNIV